MSSAVQFKTASNATVDFVDDLDRTIDEASQDPAFRAALQDAEAKHRLLDTLVHCRRDQQLTQTDVALRMGVKQSTVSGFENEDADPRLSTLQRYARAVGGRLRVTLATGPACDWLPSTGGAYAPPHDERSTVHNQRVAVRASDNVMAWPRRPRIASVA